MWFLEGKGGILKNVCTMVSKIGMRPPRFLSHYEIFGWTRGVFSRIVLGFRDFGYDFWGVGGDVSWDYYSRWWESSLPLGPPSTWVVICQHTCHLGECLGAGKKKKNTKSSGLTKLLHWSHTLCSDLNNEKNSATSHSPNNVVVFFTFLNLVPL